MNHFKVKLMTYGLIFNNDNSRIRIQDMILTEKPIPILINQQFKTWLEDYSNNTIGTALLGVNDSELFAQCQFDMNLMMTQPKHDHIIMRTLKGTLIPFNSLSFHIDLMNYEIDKDCSTIRQIINARFKSLSPVFLTADPGTPEPFLFGDITDKNKEARQAIIFPGQLFNNYILD